MAVLKQLCIIIKSFIANVLKGKSHIKAQTNLVEFKLFDRTNKPLNAFQVIRICN